ncbi:hypothetical protein EPH95_00045 [Salicibibacter halophilus]|uniref:Uncharacterized protein n=1 Tax=Salicibibacter halophilus TaxID=2502791 RepID=A0A514LD32_9BACI|nr:hypothetical protein [Salicibibacter halophilus]QDI89760.1 hypothetical protein EPH95_00045 [Salicibibacter halophilus]
MRAKYVFFTIMTALIMFLTGVLSGHYYAYYQWGEVYQDDGQTVSVNEEEMEAEEEKAENDLEHRQENVRESESTNFFSEIGKTIGGSPR